MEKSVFRKVASYLCILEWCGAWSAPIALIIIVDRRVRPSYCGTRVFRPVKFSYFHNRFLVV